MSADNFWTDDGSNLVTSSGATVHCEGENPGSPVNALYKNPQFALGPNPGEIYWTISLDKFESTPFIGLASEKNFKTGWATNGYFFGGPGNVSSGSAGLIIGFDDVKIRPGATVGVLGQIDSSRLKIFFFHDKKPLGLAFDVPVQPDATPFYPCVQFSGKSSAGTIKKEDGVPSASDRVRKNDFDPSSPIGHWALETCALEKVVEPTLTFFPEDGSANTFQASLKIINHIRFEVKRGEGGGAWTFTAGPSTLMGSSPEAMQFESQLTNLMAQVKGVELSAESLKCSTPGGDVVVWKRSFKTFEAVKST